MKFAEKEQYYMILFSDNEGAYPQIECFVFIGKNIFHDEENDTWYFQYSDSFGRYGSILETDKGDRKIREVAESELDMYLDLEQLTKQLVISKEKRERVRNKSKSKKPNSFDS
jgi:hypothetical protein